MSLDLDAIKARIARSGPFSIPRWVAIDLNALIAEVERLREGAPPTEYVTEMRKLRSQVGVLERDLARRKDAHAAEVAQLQEQVSLDRSNAAQMEYEVEAERLAFVHYLRSFAQDTPPGPISPVRRSAQEFAARAAAIIERGEHRTTHSVLAQEEAE